MMQIIYPVFTRMRQFHFLWLFSFLALFFTSCEQRKTIVNGLDEKEANEIVVFLANHGVDSNKALTQETGGGGNKSVLWDITVPSDKSIEAMAILNANGLPKRRGQNLLGLFSAGGLVPSEMQEKIKYQAGLAEQIAGTIRKIDGILDADIQLSIPEEDALGLPGAEKGTVTASVYIKHQGVMDDPNSHLVTKVKRLVSSSIPGLEYDNVTVISDRARFAEALVKETAPEKQWARVWGVIVAKESLSRFRWIFFSFCFLILSLMLSLVWITWKVYPLLRKGGGLAALFHLSPLDSSQLPSSTAATPAADQEASKVLVAAEAEQKVD